jgi:chitinase
MSTGQPRTRRLSKSRLAISVLALAAIVGGAVYWGSTTASQVSASTTTPWFAGYVDVTNTPSFAFEAASSDSAKDVVLSFIVADPSQPCTPSWGAAYSMDEAASQLDLDRRITRLENAGGEAIVSFGGQANDELATACTDASDLQAAYASVIDRYDLTTIDLDLEGPSLSSAANERRATAVAALQKAAKAAGSSLAVWLTLPVTPQGLAKEGTDAVAAFLDAGVDLAGVNAMTMDYGSSKPASDSMLVATEAALTATQRQLGILYDNAKISLTDATLWSKIGATPMIGQNDITGEVFTLADATGLNTWAAERGLGRISMWSLNRDTTCGTSFTDTNRVSNECSGVDQGNATFAETLGSGMTGSPQSNSDVTTTAEAIPADQPDDPATSPYVVWDKNATYLVGTKVTWHHNVYEAKWWTSGDLPDDGVLDEFETPWTLIGPVLPGETPIPIPTVPPGTYADWSGTAIYQQGDRVLFNGLAFEAKWWTQGDSPEASSSSPDNSPWAALTTAQIQAILDGTGG